MSSGLDAGAFTVPAYQFTCWHSYMRAHTSVSVEMQSTHASRWWRSSHDRRVLPMTTDLDSQTAPAPAVDPDYERRWLILLVVLIALVMTLIDATVINVALPSAQADLHFSTAN